MKNDDRLGGGYGWEEDHEDNQDDDLDFAPVTRNLDSKTADPKALIAGMQEIEKRQIHLADEVRKGRRAESELREQLEEKSTDYKALKQRLAEVQAGATPAAQGDDKALKGYVAADGGVRLRGGIDRETGDWIPGLFDDPKAKNAWQQDVQRAMEDITLYKAVRGKSAWSPKLGKRVSRILATAPDFIKRAPGFEDKTRAFVDGSGSGAEWVIDLGLPQVAADPRLRSDLEMRFPEHVMQAQTELLPYMSTALRPYKKVAASGDDPAQFTSSSMATAQRTISSTGMVVRAQVDRDAADDSIIAALPFIRQEAINALRDGFEDCLINGDTNATHQDTGLATWDPRSRWGSSGLGGSDDHRRTFLGFRAHAKDVSGGSADENGAQTYAGYVGWRANLAAPRGILSDLLYVFSIENYLVKILTMTEFKTFDVVSGQGANETGAVRQIAGVPVLISEYLTADLATSGLNTGSGSTTGGLLISTQRFRKTVRQGPMVEIDVDITRDVYNIVAKNRKGLFDLDNSGKVNAYYGFNLSAS